METTGRILPRLKLNFVNTSGAFLLGSAAGWLSEGYFDLAPAKKVHWPSMGYAIASTGLAVVAALSQNETWMLLSLGALGSAVTSGLAYMAQEKKSVIQLGKPV